MTRLSSRLASLHASQIREMMRLAQQVGAINMAQGAPDFPAAAEVKQAAVEAIHADHNQYTVPWGLEALRVAVAEMLGKRYGLRADPASEVTITCGVTEGMVAVLLALLEPGDEVIIVEPAHENYVPAVAFAGGVPRYVPLLPPQFALEPDALAAAVTPRTRFLILNTPHNPTGRVFTREELASVAELAAKHDLVVITDEIYDRLTYHGHEHIAFATLPGMAERTVTCGGISKIHAVTGWRLAYVIAPEALSAGIRKVHDYLTICAPTPFQHAALTALAMPESYYDRIRREFAERRDRLVEAFQAAGIAAEPPQGAYYVLGDVSAWKLGEEATETCRYFIQHVGVATVPGPAFYYGHPEIGRTLLRFAFAKQMSTLDDVAARLERGYARRHRQ